MMANCVAMARKPSVDSAVTGDGTSVHILRVFNFEQTAPGGGAAF